MRTFLGRKSGDYKISNNDMYLATDTLKNTPIHDGSFIYSIFEDEIHPAVYKIISTGIFTDDNGNTSEAFAIEERGDITICEVSSDRYYPDLDMAISAKEELTKVLSVQRSSLHVQIPSEVLQDAYVAMSNDDRIDSFTKNGLGSPQSGLIEYLLLSYISGNVQ